MKNTFILGSFLRGHTSSFGRRGYPRPSTRAYNGDLEKRVAARAERGETKKVQHRTLLLGSASAALLLLILAFRLPIHPSAPMEFDVTEQETISMEEIVPTQQKAQLPPPPAPPVPVAVADDVQLEDETLDLDASLDLDAPLTNTAPPPPPAEESDEKEAVEHEVFSVVEVMPEIVGGMASLAKALEYPEAARRAGIEGTVVVSVIVDENGQPTRPEVLRSPAEVLERAAVEAVMEQRFTPGRQRSQVVRVKTAIPVRFQLK